MTKPKTLDQLQAEKERAETQLAQEQHKLNRLENRKKYLEKGERQKRTQEQHGHTYKKSLNNHINITFKFKESPLSFTEST